MSLHSSRSSRLSSISSNCSEDFWQQFEAKQSSSDTKNTFASTLKLKMQTLLGKKPQPARKLPVRPTRAVCRDNFDPLIQDFEIKLKASRFRDDTDYLREYTLNFNKWRTTKHFQQMMQSPVYDDVFSEQYTHHQHADGLANYSDVFEEDCSDYSDVCEQSMMTDGSVYTDVCDDGVAADGSSEYSDSQNDDYCDVYSEYSKISYDSLDGDLSRMPPPLPRRMSDSRPPARPPVPFKGSSVSLQQRPALPPRLY